MAMRYLLYYKIWIFDFPVTAISFWLLHIPLPVRDLGLVFICLPVCGPCLGLLFRGGRKAFVVFLPFRVGIIVYLDADAPGWERVLFLFCHFGTILSIFLYKNNAIPLTGGAGDGTIFLRSNCIISDALSRYRIYVRTVPVGAGAVFTFDVVIKLTIIAKLFKIVLPFSFNI